MPTSFPSGALLSEPKKSTHSRLLDAATVRFKEQGLGASVAEIARDAGAFPNQVTHHFGSKEALFVEAACRAMLYLAREAEIAASAVNTDESYTEALIRAVVGAPGLSLFIEALALTRRRPDLAPQVQKTFERLHAEGDRAYSATVARQGWRAPNAAVSARRFWTLALGIGLRTSSGETAEALRAEMLTLLRRDED
ncbi:MAG: TetR/AcrR family transcriptional regulator C-terminal domain-containing protein [Caulobacteraceae bacterium]